MTGIEGATVQGKADQAGRQGGRARQGRERDQAEEVRLVAEW